MDPAQEKWKAAGNYEKKFASRKQTEISRCKMSRGNEGLSGLKITNSQHCPAEQTPRTVVTLNTKCPTFKDISNTDIPYSVIPFQNTAVSCPLQSQQMTAVCTWSLCTLSRCGSSFGISSMMDFHEGLHRSTKETVCTMTTRNAAQEDFKTMTYCCWS